MEISIAKIEKCIMQSLSAQLGFEDLELHSSVAADWETLSNYVVVQADFNNDPVISSSIDFLKNFNNIYDTDENKSAIGKFSKQIDDVDTSTNPIITRSSFLANNTTGFNVMTFPVTYNSEIQSRGNATINTEVQDAMISAYTAAFDTSEESQIHIATGSNLRNISYIKSSYELSSMFPISTRSYMIDIASIYEYFLGLAGILERIKIFKYTYNFKKSRFFGRMNIQKLTNVFPDLPTSSSKDVPTSYYSAVLASPLAQYYIVSMAQSEYSEAFDTIFSSENILQLNSLTEKSLVYTEDMESDVPTFDVSSKDGSNGVYTDFKVITTETYDLKSQLQDIYDIFNIKKNSIISGTNIIQALAYLYQQWLLNIKVFQVDVYACHYNCHINSIDGDVENVENRLRTYYKNISYLIDDSSDTIFNTSIKPYLSFENQPTTYEFTPNYDITDPNYANEHAIADSVQLNIPYPYFTGTTTDPIHLCAYIKMTNSIGGWSGEHIVDITDVVSFTDNPDTVLSINAAYCARHGVEQKSLVVDSALGRRILSSIGDFEFHFVKYSPNDSKDHDLRNAQIFFTNDDGSVEIDGISYTQAKLHDTYGYPTKASPLTGYIYYDKSSTSMQEYINMANRENKTYAKIYEPTPILAYKHDPLKPCSVISYSDLVYSYANNDINTDTNNTPTVFIRAKPDNYSIDPPYINKYGGSTFANFNILPLPTVDLGDESTIQFTFSAMEDPLYKTGQEIKYESITVKEIGAAQSPIPEDMFDIAYFNNIGPGEARVTITPSEKYGKSYFHGEYTKTFTIEDRSSGRFTPKGDGITVGPYVIDGDEGAVLERWVNWNTTKDTEKHSYRSVFAYPTKWRNIFGANIKYDCVITYRIEREAIHQHYVQGLVEVKVGDSVVAMDMYAGRIKRDGQDPAKSVEAQFNFTWGPYDDDEFDTEDAAIGIMTMPIGVNRGTERYLYATLYYSAEASVESGYLIVKLENVDIDPASSIISPGLPDWTNDQIKLDIRQGFVNQYNKLQLFDTYVSVTKKIKFSMPAITREAGSVIAGNVKTTTTYTYNIECIPSQSYELTGYTLDTNITAVVGGNEKLKVTTITKNSIQHNITFVVGKLTIGLPSATNNTKYKINTNKVTYTTYSGGVYTNPFEAQYTPIFNQLTSMFESSTYKGWVEAPTSGSGTKIIVADTAQELNGIIYNSTEDPDTGAITNDYCDIKYKFEAKKINGASTNYVYIKSSVAVYLFNVEFTATVTNIETY